MKSIHNYDDIYDLPRPEPRRHTRMSAAARAAQFMPFAALTGYASVIEEVSRTTDEKLQLDENEINSINKKLRFLKAHGNRTRSVQIRSFRKDTKKEGGSYVTAEGRVKKIDEYSGYLTMEDGTVIAFDGIISIQINKNRKEDNS